MTDEGSAKRGGAWRWAIGGVVVLLLLYPLARLMMSGGGAADVARTAPGASALQLSFEHYRAGRYQDAATAARAALQADPNSADAYNNLAVSYLGLKMYDDAVQAAQEAIRLRPDYQLATNNLKMIQEQKATANGTAVSPDQITAANVLLNQSLEHSKAGRFKECMDTATQSARLNPNSAAAFNNIGICAGNLHLWDEAIRNTQEAIRLDPNFQLAKNNLVWVQQQKALQAGKAP